MPARARAPMMKTARTNGIFTACAPIWRISRVPTAWMTAPAPRKSSALKTGMAEQVELAGEDRPGADRIDHVAELADGGIGQDALQVVGHAAIRAASSAVSAPTLDHRQPPVRHIFKGRVEARQQVDAGVDHRGGMDQGADRGGRFHGVGQPGLEGHLRRFGGRGDQEAEGSQAEQQRPARPGPAPGNR